METDVTEERMEESDFEEYRKQEAYFENLMDGIMVGDTNARSETLTILRKAAYLVNQMHLAFSVAGDGCMTEQAIDAYYELGKLISGIERPKINNDPTLPF